MGAYKYITRTFQQQYKQRDDRLKSKIISWRKEPAIVKIERPTNIARARTLGYKAKQGYIVVRTRVEKGRRTRRRPRGGRKHKNYYFRTQPQLSHQAIAEQRVNRIHNNMEVLNSYWVGDDGNYIYFEIILVDPAKPSVNISSAIRQGKTFRGLTSSGNSRTPSKKKTLNKKRRMKQKETKVYKRKEHFKRKEKKPKSSRTLGSKARRAAKRKKSVKKE
ncbi:50S ribosomal protein L15e [Candidatus Micrarchaeota archaeon]|nr:50S ribosomal protein L15e [Candidatus Micrarchaeota archaeon]